MKTLLGFARITKKELDLFNRIMRDKINEDKKAETLRVPAKYSVGQVVLYHPHFGSYKLARVIEAKNKVDSVWMDNDYTRMYEVQPLMPDGISNYGTTTLELPEVDLYIYNGIRQNVKDGWPEVDV